MAAVAAHTATAVVPHTFHGGDDPLAAPAPRAAWWDNAAGREADKAAVHASFPGFVLDDNEGGYVWHGASPQPKPWGGMLRQRTSKNL